MERRDGQRWGEAVVAALDERVAVVAVLATHWTDGGSVDLAAIGARAREAGAALVVDASQAVGAMPLDWPRIRPDYLVTVGYKWLLGPFALGYLHVAEPHRDGVPLEENWISRLGSEDFAALVDYQDRYQPGARRFDVGQRTHFETTPMATPPSASCSTGRSRGSPPPWAGSPAASSTRSRRSASGSPPATGSPTCSASTCPTRRSGRWPGRSPTPGSTPGSGARPCASPRTCGPPTRTSSAWSAP